MTIAPTLEGGLRIDAGSLADWTILEFICTDANNLPGAPLYDRISSKMVKNDDWNEFVVPDIVTQFDEQVSFVSRAIASTPRDEEHTGSIMITKDDAMKWYGTVNQARLSLEQRHHLSTVEEIITDEDLDALGPDIRSAVIRNHFYTAIQSLLLEFVL